MGIILRWTLLLWSVTASITSYAGEQWEVIRSGAFEGLAEKSGVVLIPPIYDAIGWSDGSQEVSGQIIGYKEGVNWGLISIKNKKRPPQNLLFSFQKESG